MQIKIRKSLPEAQIPVYSTDGAACFDLYAASVEEATHRSHVYNTGLQFEIPADHVMLIFSRSGHGFKHGIRLANSVGVIDSDYRGDVKVKLTTHIVGALPSQGERVAQAMILPVKQVSFEEVEVLSETERGEGGFGSTGEK